MSRNKKDADCYEFIYNFFKFWRQGAKVKA